MIYESLNYEKIKSKFSYEDISLFIYDEIDSTNTEARRYIIGGGEAPAAFIANSQSAGRGRVGRSFYSPSDTGIYLSLVFKAESSDILFMTTAAAVAVHRAIHSELSVKTDIKWVNDLYLDGKKICGILAEAFYFDGSQYVIIGVGINLSTKDFPDDISSVAGSLGVSDSHRCALCAACISELYSAALAIENGDTDRFADIIGEYRQNSMVIGKDIIYTGQGEWRAAHAVSIDERGRLIVENADGSVSLLSSGEISLRLKKET